MEMVTGSVAADGTAGQQLVVPPGAVGLTSGQYSDLGFSLLAYIVYFLHAIYFLSCIHSQTVFWMYATLNKSSLILCFIVYCW